MARASVLTALLFAAVLLPFALSQETRTTDSFRAYLRAMERFGFSGSVLVAKDGTLLVADGFGLANREKGVRNERDAQFEIASATKPFTAVAILQLDADGRLSCDDPVSKHLPGVPPAVSEVTIRHLLTHTSGMSRMSPTGSGENLERAVKAYFSAKPARKPGAGHEYWNGGYALLAGVVERASGGTYMNFVRKRIFEPAGMKSSGFTGDSDRPRCRREPHRAQDRRPGIERGVPASDASVDMIPLGVATIAPTRSNASS